MTGTLPDVSAIRSIPANHADPLIGLWVVDSRAQVSGRIVDVLAHGVLVEGADHLRVLTNLDAVRLYRDRETWASADIAARQRWNERQSSLADQPLPTSITKPMRPRLVARPGITHPTLGTIA